MPIGFSRVAPKTERVVPNIILAIAKENFWRGIYLKV